MISKSSLLALLAVLFLPCSVLAEPAKPVKPSPAATPAPPAVPASSPAPATPATPATLASSPAPASGSLPEGPQITSRAYLLQDFQTGQILLEKSADDVLDPASLTKLMTAYVVFKELRNGRIKLADKVRISENAWRTGGSRMYINVNSEVPLEDLLRGMIIQSGNDASVALAEFVAGSEESFAGLMNQEAQRLGMKNTLFANATGMPADKHVSSARDLGLIAAAVIRDFPDYYKYYSERQYAYNNITQHNRNVLLERDSSVDGMKTGYTENAGYCLITSAKRNETRLISVILGSPNSKVRADESEKLLNYGFRFYETYLLYQANQALTTERVWSGDGSAAKFGVRKPIYVTIPRGRYNELKASVRISQEIQAPVKADSVYGTVKVMLGEQVLVDQPLLALEEVPEGNFIQRTLDYVTYQFK
jgi:D-alanyl-D-alanine carboxypeptidase (penicillin-binding protein 5/6)